MGRAVLGRYGRDRLPRPKAAHGIHRSSSPKGQRVYELGQRQRSPNGCRSGADVEFMGEFVGATIVMGESNAEPLLGVTALESVGIEIDPRDQTLKRLPAVRLKGLRRHTQLRHI